MATTRLKIRIHRMICSVLLSGLLGGALVVTPAHAAGITVTSSADTSADDGTCTLQEALSNANTDSQLYATAGECAAGSGSDTITFDASLSGATIYLGSTLTINQDVTIDGSALAAQISLSGDSDNNGSGDVRVLTINSGAVILDSLTITKGGNSTGGGIMNASAATLTLRNSTLAGNRATGGPGGGIRSDGALTVINSTFSDNTATASGGGIRSSKSVTVTNSTFSGNTAGGSGGGIYNVNGYLSVTVTNSTFSGNSAKSSGGGIYYEASGTLNYANTIIANSTSGGDCAGSGTIGTNINNLVENGGCAAALSGDPGLWPLANNGGPGWTFALLTVSPALDAGDDATCAAAPVGNLDQRGVTRPVGAHCDIGAFEGSVADSSAPTVTAFAAPTSSASLTIPITAFTALDNVAVTGYLITESAVPPSAGAGNWTSAAPTTYDVSSDGAHTLYPWAKDATGNVSAVYGSPASVNVDTTSPAVTINQGTGQSDPTNANEILFDVVFDEAVTGFDQTDVTISGIAATPTITVTDSGDSMHFTVAVSGMTNGETVSASIPAAAASDSLGNASAASASTDNTVAYASLSGLTLSSGSLTPAFAVATTSYTATVPFSESSITITPTTADNTATVKVNGVPVTSGTPSAAIALATGPTTITVECFNLAGTTTQTITVTVTRQSGSMVWLPLIQR